MKIEHQVCSLELAQKLKDLNVKQESHFYWILNGHGISPLSPKYDPIWELVERRKSLDFQQSRVSAFTVSELGELLPGKIPQKNPGDEDGGYLDMIKTSDTWLVYYIGYPGQGAETEADARAKLLIYLLSTECSINTLEN